MRTVCSSCLVILCVCLCMCACVRACVRAGVCGCGCGGVCGVGVFLFGYVCVGVCVCFVCWYMCVGGDVCLWESAGLFLEYRMWTSKPLKQAISGVTVLKAMFIMFCLQGPNS